MEKYQHPPQHWLTERPEGKWWVGEGKDWSVRVTLQKKDPEIQSQVRCLCLGEEAMDMENENNIDIWSWADKGCQIPCMGHDRPCGDLRESGYLCLGLSSIPSNSRQRATHPANNQGEIKVLFWSCLFESRVKIVQQVQTLALAWRWVCPRRRITVWPRRAAYYDGPGKWVDPTLKLCGKRTHFPNRLPLVCLIPLGSIFRVLEYTPFPT